MVPNPTNAAATVTKIIHDARWMAGLTQAEVAQRAGVSQQTVAQYERGKRQPSVATLTRLVAGCGLKLSWTLTPEAGLADQPTLDLLALAPLERLTPSMADSLTALIREARDLDVLVGGKTAARMQGAFIRVYEIELLVDEYVDLDVLAHYLLRAGVEYVSPSGHVEAATPTREALIRGWPLVAPACDLYLRSVSNIRLRCERALTIELPPGHHPMLVAATEDCAAWWYDRDLDHLALQRAVRLSSGQDG
jgi:transcriptional regulator with XRE-family HTH domain